MSKKGVFFYFFGLYSKTALTIFPIFCMSVEDNSAQQLDGFAEKVLNTKLKGIKCFYFFALYSNTALPNFLHECRGQ